MQSHRMASERADDFRAWLSTRSALTELAPGLLSSLVTHSPITGPCTVFHTIVFFGITSFSSFSLSLSEAMNLSSNNQQPTEKQVNLDDWLATALKNEYPPYATKSTEALPSITPIYEKTHQLLLDPGRRVGIAKWKMCLELMFCVYIVVALLTIPFAYQSDLLRVLDVEQHPYHSFALALLLVMVAVPSMMFVVKPLVDLVFWRVLFRPLPEPFDKSLPARFAYGMLIG